MARMTLEQLKQKFIDDKKGGGGNLSKKFFPFFEMEYDQSSYVRFVPDADTENPFGWYVEKYTHTIVVGGKKKRYPCRKTYGHKDCPMCQLSNDYYKAGDEETGKKWWARRSIIAQVIPTDTPLKLDPIPDDEDNVVRLVEMNTNLFDIIVDALLTEDIDTEVDDLENGYDFRIRKTLDGKWADYRKSKFDTKSRGPVSPALLRDAKPFNLAEQLPKEMSVEELEKVIEKIINGEDDDSSSDGESSGGRSSNRETPRRGRDSDDDGGSSRDSGRGRGRDRDDDEDGGSPRRQAASGRGRDDDEDDRDSGRGRGRDDEDDRDSGRGRGEDGSSKRTGNAAAVLEKLNRNRNRSDD